MRRPLYRPTYLLTADGLADVEEDARAAATEEAMAQSSGVKSGSTMNAVTTSMKRAVIESVSKTIAAQLAITIATYTVLQAFPIIGQIISAIMAIIGLVTAPYVKAHTKQIVDETKRELLAYAQGTMTTITEHAYAVTEEEFSSAQQLALSNVSLDGWLRDTFDQAGGAVTDALRDVARPIAKPAARATIYPLKLTEKSLIKTGIVVSGAIGDKRSNERFRKLEQTMDKKTKYLENTFTKGFSDPVQMVRELHTEPFKLLSGLQQLDVIRRKTRELLAKGKGDLDTYRANWTDRLDSADYRDAVRAALAKAIRANPILQSQAAAAMQVTGTTPGNGATAPASSAASAGGMLSFAAIIGYFLLHK